MKKYISSSIKTLQYSACSIDKLTPSQLDTLPEYFTCYTRSPGGYNSEYIFRVVSKDKLLTNPEKCFFIDSYWGYAFPHDVYLATVDTVERYQARELQKLKDQEVALRKECRNLWNNIAPI